MNKTRSKQANLLMIVNDENNPHSTIKNVSSLMSSLSSKHFNALHYSMYYLNGFQTEEKE